MQSRKNIKNVKHVEQASCQNLLKSHSHTNNLSLEVNHATFNSFPLFNSHKIMSIWMSIDIWQWYFPWSATPGPSLNIILSRLWNTNVSIKSFLILVWVFCLNLQLIVLEIILYNIALVYKKKKSKRKLSVYTRINSILRSSFSTFCLAVKKNGTVILKIFQVPQQSFSYGNPLLV